MGDTVFVGDPAGVPHMMVCHFSCTGAGKRVRNKVADDVPFREYSSLLRNAGKTISHQGYA
jgi:hypothetical protein